MPGGADVLAGLDLTLFEDERIAVTGPTGAGKTTLLQLMVGLLTPFSGTVNAFGRERVSEKDFREVRARTGFCFQNPDDQLFCATVLEDVAFGPLNLGKSRDEALAVSLETLDELGLENYENKVTYRLSGGEKRLVSLASVLSMRPDVLLLDEPSNGLDDYHSDKLIEILNSINKTIVIVSHNNAFNEKTCGNFLRLENGQAKPAISRGTGH
ncbi:MAG: energy-coupling factor ABC transporter ATP-binding protein [Lentisphaerae bacterium GWF2_45_14]|nr:MAG: energy-coupling factor ABC transporter ATP-binding protein [Lentisphaerae bacterium GWF2_45_14]